MERINASLPVDIRLFPYEVRQNITYAKALFEIKILDETEFNKITKALVTMMSEFEDGMYDELPQDEDVHSLIERRLVEITGNAGRKIHTGRSRNEEVITAVKMYLRDEITKLRENIHALVKSLVKTAKENKDVVMPGYTHLQHAQPILFSHYLCSFAYALRDDNRRLFNTLSSGLAECPMGSGAIAGSAFPINREAMAKELGFKKPTPNSINGVSQRDDLLEVMSALSTIMIHLSRYAEDMIIWSTNEFGFIELDESVTTGSSMMPQKKNPDSLELIRGKSARVIGSMQTLFTLMKGLPLTYARDMQEDKRPLFDSCDEVNLCLSVFKDVIDTLKVNKEQMASRIENALFATDTADYLTKKGMPFRESHKTVGGLIQNSIATGRSISDFSVEELKTHSPLFEKDVFLCLKPEYSIKARDLLGGTGPNSVENQLKELENWITAHS